MDCYKTIIEDIGNPVKNWYSEESLFIDDCSTSDAGGTITLKKWELWPSVTERGIVLGSDNSPGSAGCFRFAEWTKWAPYVAQVGFDVAESLGIDLEPSLVQNIKTYAASTAEKSEQNSIVEKED